MITPPGSGVKISLRDEDNNTNDEDILNNKNGKNGKFNTIVTNVKINSNMVSSAILKELLPCQWDNCNLEFFELLYYYLCQDHVGRKSQRNLQLNCHWIDCKVTTKKRDHITSHLRVHVPLEPFICSIYHKLFKRPQDLKKHLEIHLESNKALKKKRSRKLGSKNSVKRENYAIVDFINLKKFINNDMYSLEPLLNPNLKNKLKNILPLPKKYIPDPTQSQNVSTLPPVDPVPPQVLIPHKV